MFQDTVWMKCVDFWVCMRLAYQNVISVELKKQEDEMKAYDWCKECSTSSGVTPHPFFKILFKYLTFWFQDFHEVGLSRHDTRIKETRIYKMKASGVRSHLVFKILFKYLTFWFQDFHEVGISRHDSRTQEAWRQNEGIRSKESWTDGEAWHGIWRKKVRQDN